MSKISIISAAYNEECSLYMHAERLQTVIQKHNVDAEIIIVDDASTDASVRILQDICAKNSNIHAYGLRQNSQKSGAIAVGAAHATGTYIVFMDCDLQDDPASIPIILNPLEHGADAAIGWRKHRQDSLGKMILSRASNAFANIVFGTKFHDMNSSIKAVRADVIRDILLEQCVRFLPHVLRQKQCTVVEVPVQHHARMHGKSHFGFWNRLHTIPDMLRVQKHAYTKKKLPEHYSISAG